AALAVTNRPELVGQRPPSISDWTALTEQVAGAPDRRVVVSSEFFADADDTSVHRVVEELGGPRVHVVVTLRPLVRILSSQWQQYVQNGMRTRYESWLRSMFEKPPYREPTPSFWRRHRHDRLVERWVEAAGADNLTVVVADESDPLMLVRTFERLLALPEGILVPEAELTNRSLTAGEAEFARLLNEEFRKHAWPDDLYQKLFRAGAVLQMKGEHEPSKDEPRIATPEWAVKKAVALNAEMVEKIQTMGVRIVGDTDSLCRVPTTRTPVGPPMMSPESALQAVLGALLAAGAFPDPERPQRFEDLPVREATARTLARVLAARVRRRVRRTLRR
ncbi:MAG: hypothetical protein J2P14_09480, partial [Acidothermales bacterium]|nr:hypothetical protein [Acidothermales bacterium]